MEAKLNVRPSPIAGQWYPGDAHRLSASVDEFMSQADLPEINGEVLGLIAPHAGHRYSGPVAGYSFKAVKGLTPDIVFVLSPMHYPYHEPLLTSAHTAYQTPLGEIPVDHAVLKKLDSHLLAELGFGLTRVGYDNEHSLEIELPFLQQSLAKPFRLVPIMMRDQSWKVSQGLGNAISSLFMTEEEYKELSFLLVASSDLSHFYSREDANTLDGVMLDHIKDFDPEALVDADDKGRGFACGRGAVASVMWAARRLGANSAWVLHYATSGDITGDYDRVVGYAAAVIARV